MQQQYDCVTIQTKTLPKYLKKSSILYRVQELSFPSQILSSMCFIISEVNHI